MTDVNDDEVTTSEETTTAGVGEQLRLAREAKGFTVAEVAAQLRLTRHTVTHLETEQWGKLHGRAYARGYFSNYVKFLGLPEDKLLTAFNIEYQATEESLLPVPEQRLKKHKVAWLYGAGTLAVLFIIGLAYQQWQDSQVSGDDSTVSQWEKLNDAMDIFNASVVEPLPDSEQKIVNVGEEMPANEQQSSEQQEEEVPASEIQDAVDSDSMEPVTMNSVLESATFAQAEMTGFSLRVES